MCVCFIYYHLELKQVLHQFIFVCKFNNTSNTLSPLTDFLANVPVRSIYIFLVLQSC